MPKLSIIVPVYNVEPYLRRCLDSILSQTYTDFEAIIIDDGSPDNCGAIIDEYANKDKRIIPIHQHNKGVSSARNAGIRAARGDYMGFVDPDDWIDNRMYELMINSIKAYDSDLVCCGWVDVENEIEKEHQIVNDVTVFTRTRFSEKIFDLPRTIVGSTCILNKIFKRSMIKIPFSENITIYEDAEFLLNYCLNINSAVVIPCNSYYVFHRSCSLSHQNPLKNVQYLYIRENMITKAGQISKKCKDKAEADYLDACYRYLNLIDDNKDQIRLNMLINQMYKYFKNNLRSIYMNKFISLKLKVIYTLLLAKFKKKV